MNSRAHPIHCVALDFDLTMFDYSRPQDTRVLMPWFQRLHDAGVMVGIASGRTLDNLGAELRGIEMAWGEPFPRFVIHEEFYLHWPDAPEQEAVRQWNRACALAVKSLCRDARPYFDSCEAQMRALGIRIESAVAATDAGLTLVLENPAAAERARRLLQEMIPADCPARISRNHHIVLATPAAYHKGSALDRLRVLGGFQPRDILAIGDNLNDLAMIDQALGFRCATVLNADPMVQDAVAVRQGLQATCPIAFGIVELFDSLFDQQVGNAR